MIQIEIKGENEQFGGHKYFMNKTIFPSSK
jgi:hypothetical protein